MAKKQKSDGQKVREALDGPQVEHDELIAEILERSKEQFSRSSDASESAAKVAKYMEKTGLNTQAYSWGSAIMKKLPKKDGQAKAMDIIRSLKVLLPMLENHIAGQGSAEMDLDGPSDDNQADEADEQDGEPTIDDVIKDGDPELAAEADDFEKQSNVVTPLNFGGASK